MIVPDDDGTDGEIEVQQIPGFRRSGTLYSTGRFLYHKTQVNRRTTNYRCRRYKDLHCLARLLKEDGVFWTTGLCHNHANETGEIRRLTFVNECCRRVAQQPVEERCFKRTFDQVQQEYPDVAVSFNEALKRKMQRSIQENQPQIPIAADNSGANDDQQPAISQDPQPVADPVPALAAAAGQQQNNFLCETCKTNFKSRVFVPCGHTFCHQCAEQLEIIYDEFDQAKCFICTSVVHQVYKCYF